MRIKNLMFAAQVKNSCQCCFSKTFIVIIHNNYILSQENGDEGWMIFELTMRKFDTARNQTCDCPITRGMLCHLNYLSMIAWKVHSRIIRVGHSSHSAKSRLGRWERDIFQTIKKMHVIRLKISTEYFLNHSYLGKLKKKSEQFLNQQCESVTDQESNLRPSHYYRFVG